MITIDWNTLSINEWEEKFSRIPRSNILQSYTYAKAMCPIARQKARWGLILVDGKEAGLVQILEAGIFRNAIHAMQLDRGPLWLEGFGSAIHIKQFFTEWNRQFPRRFGRKRRILPEIEDGIAIQKLLPQTGLVDEKIEGYRTFWLDLTKGEEELRAAIKPNWRGSLVKAEKSDLSISPEINPEIIAWVLAVYASDKAARAYGGPSPEFLKAYLPLLVQAGNLHISRALIKGDAIAFVVIAIHGRSATYLAGWSCDEGRKYSAHHHLLWEGAIVLQQKGIKDFDLGGINDDEASAGLTKFKEGMGGRKVICSGLYS